MIYVPCGCGDIVWLLLFPLNAGSMGVGGHAGADPRGVGGPGGQDPTLSCDTSHVSATPFQNTDL